eukprot:5857974-Pyramimonas_sp.AAC.1
MDFLCGGCTLSPSVAEFQVDSLRRGLHIDYMCVRRYTLIPFVAEEEGRVSSQQQQSKMAP